MARGSFWDELSRDRERRKRAETARMRAEAQIRRDDRRVSGTQRQTAATLRSEGEAQAAHHQAELDTRMAVLTGLLRDVVAFPVPTIVELRLHPPVPEPEPFPDEPPRWPDFAPPEPGFWHRFGHARAEAEARRRFDDAFAAYDARRAEAAERHRLHLDEIRDDHEHRLDQLIGAAYGGDVHAPAELAAAVLESVAPLRRFVGGGRGVYRPEARELGIEVELPGKDTIPADGRWRWAVRERAVVAEPRKDSADRYRELVAAVTLAIVSACFRSFPPEPVDRVTVNGKVDAVDPATGRPTACFLVSVSVARATYDALRLDDPGLDVVGCLRALGAELSDNPYALANITPLLDVDLVSRYRLTTSAEELAALDHRADLMQMDPYEFEGLIAELFRAKGYESWRTQSSRDDGIDAIASRRDAHVPVECLIQVKRTRNVVPPKEIQALMGALAEHPTATNGLLVTTSWFSDRSRRRGQDRRIGTMEGGELREQIKTYLGRDVVISATPPPRRR